MKFIMGDSGLVLATGVEAAGEKRWPGVFGWVIDRLTGGAYSEWDAMMSKKMDIFSWGLLDSLSDIAVIASMMFILWATISGGKAMSWGFKFMILGLILKLGSAAY